MGGVLVSTRTVTKTKMRRMTTKEDQAFIDDDLEEEDNPSFYCRVDLQWVEQQPIVLQVAPV